MCRYRIEFKPLEPYTLGTEQGSKFKGVDSTGMESYIIASDLVPSQTTIFGTIRYLILQQSKKIVINKDYSYNQEEQQKIADLIGKESFKFNVSTPADFGIIKEISPIYLMKKMDNKKEIYIRNPFCNKSKNNYTPIKMSENKFYTSQGEIHLPQKEEYEVKSGYGGGYIGLNTKEVVNTSDIFTKELQTGNATKESTDGFFKREVVKMKDDFVFAVELVTSEPVLENTKTVVYMGRKQSAFSVEINESDSNVITKVREALGGDGNMAWTYALSDIYIKSVPCYEDFAIVETKKIRNMYTNQNNDGGFLGKRKKINNQIQLISAGSVFYGDFEVMQDDNCIRAGYNRLVKIGG